MSERHGTILQLKRHEDFEKVAAYVKQQVRDKGMTSSVFRLMRRKAAFVGATMDTTETILTSIP